MFWGASPIFVRVRRYGQNIANGAGGQGWWLVMLPGLSLVFIGLAILIWPELLAYMVATLFLFAGITLTLWGWQMRRMRQHLHRRNGTGRVYGETVYYEERVGPGSMY
jgi:Flp pilus assembly protein TadB